MVYSSSAATRVAAMQLGVESSSAHIVGWAHEMAAWFALTRGDYGSAIEHEPTWSA